MAKRIKAGGWHHRLFHSKLPWWAVAVGVVVVLGAAFAAHYGVYRVDDYFKVRANAAMNASVMEQKRVFQPGEIVTLAHEVHAQRVLGCTPGTNGLDTCRLIDAAPWPGQTPAVNEETVFTMTRNENTWRDAHDLPRIYGRIDAAELARMRAGWTPPAEPTTPQPAKAQPASATS